MRELDRRIEGLRAAWDEEAAGKLIWEMTVEAWQAGGPDDRMLSAAAELRGVLGERLSAARDPHERFRLLNLACGLERATGDRVRELDLARRAADLAGHAPDAVDRVRAVFQLAKAWYDCDDCAETIKWSREGLRLGRDLERRGAGGEALGRLLADQQSRFTVRITTVGGLEDEVDRSLAEAVARWEALGDPVGLADALGLLAEARMVQGRWEDCVRLARRALESAGYPARTAGATYALWCGGRALGRLGDPETALAWTAHSARLCQELGNASGALEARFSHASSLCLAGRGEEALAEADAVVRDVAAVNMGVLVHWVVLERAWIRMRMGRPTPPEELESAARGCVRMGHNLIGAEALYAQAAALRLAGQDQRAALEEPLALFDRFRMDWHARMARQGKLLL
jgi:tetratricopeptide (TPR) repeat protein